MPLPKPADAPVLKLFSLAGKVVLVTGGARGLGLALVQGYAEAGASVALTYSSSKGAEESARKIAADTNVTVKAYRCNVQDRASVFATVEQVRADFGRLDVVVANAGVNTHVDALDTSEEVLNSTMGVNVNGAFFTAQAAGKIFKEQGHGNLIVTASVSAVLVNIPQTQAVYNASKAAAVQLAKTLAVEWVDFARVNAISPGFIATDMINEVRDDWQKKWHEMIPGERFCDPYELKGTYVFLASDASSYITGANLIVDGGYTLP